MGEKEGPGKGQQVCVLPTEWLGQGSLCGGNWVPQLTAEAPGRICSSPK